jgi:hypothetical protein
VKADLEFVKRVSEFQICEKNLDQIKEEIRMSMIFEEANAVDGRQEDNKDSFSCRVATQASKNDEKSETK